MQLEILMPLILNYLKSSRILGGIRCNQIMVQGQYLMNYVHIVYLNTILYHWAALKTFKTISTLPHKAVHGHFIYFLWDNCFSIDSYSIS